jgi:hypothetical protein
LYNQPRHYSIPVQSIIQSLFNPPYQSTNLATISFCCSIFSSDIFFLSFF